MYKGPVAQRISVPTKRKCTCDQHLAYESCCDIFKQFLNDCKVGLEYIPKDRLFYMRSPSHTHTIDFCPWCGTKLPESLSEKRDAILRDEYGIDEDECDKKTIVKIPTEFFTDEWWKKRGL